MKKEVIYYPFLLAIYPILFLFTSNWGEADLIETLIPISISLTATFIIYCFIKKFFDNQYKPALIVSSIIVFIFFYDYFLTIIRYIVKIPDLFIFIIWLAIFSLLIFLIIKTLKNLCQISKLFNYLSIFLIILSLINIPAYIINNSGLIDKIENEITVDVNEINLDKNLNYPDIYYIIFDRYPSNSSLMEFYNFDNTYFTDYLEDLGFYVAYDSVANYPRTSLSLASSLNMEYLDFLTEIMGTNTGNTKPLYYMLLNHKLFQIFKHLGYKTYHSGSLWRFTAYNKFADENINLHKLDEFSQVLIKTTIFNPFLSLFKIYDRNRLEYDNHIYRFNEIAEISKIEEPTFIFAHLHSTHPPYVLDKDGSYKEYDFNTTSKEEIFVNQVIATNDYIKILINTIISNSEIPPIIIIQSDEGTLPERYNNNKHFNWNNATDAELRRKAKIINAIYIPGLDPDILYPTLTPVNTFRIILKYIFNMDYELLPDKNYIFVSEDKYYDFIDITARVK